MDDDLFGPVMATVLFFAVSGLLFWGFLIADYGAAAACEEIRQVDQCRQVWQPVVEE